MIINIAYDRAAIEIKLKRTITKKGGPKAALLLKRTQGQGRRLCYLRLPPPPLERPPPLRLREAL
jgi:hypothetical protein